MNERIKQLAEQANIHFSRIGILDGDPNGSARMVGYSKMELFAELIVRECAAYIDDNIGYDDCNNTHPVSGGELKDHFGVGS